MNFFSAESAFDEDWVIQDDFTRYNGDNGPTLTHPRPSEDAEE